MEAKATLDVVKTNSPSQTQQIAKRLAKELRGGDVIALYGNLGLGKTVFAQGIARGLGIKRRILSPTFVFLRSYPFVLKRAWLIFHHLDLYRGKSKNDYANLGLEELFLPNSIVVIEWAEKIKDLLPKKRIDVVLEIVDENSRIIKIDRRG